MEAALSGQRLGALVVGTTLFYVAWFFIAWYRLQLMIAPAAALPVVLAAWNYGLRGGMAVGLPLAALHMAFFVHIADGQPRLLVEGGVGNALLLAMGFGVGTLRDRVRVQLQRQRETEERYELAARGASDGLFDWNLGSDHVYYSAPFATLVGQRGEALKPSVEEWLERVHPEDLIELRRQLQEHLDGKTERFENAHRLRRKDGSWLWVLGRAIATYDAQGKARRLTGWLTDIAERKQTEEELRHHAFRDPLTGLPNRALFMDRLEQALVRCRRNEDRKVGIVLLDLDRFKVVNDSLGHMAGDELLVAVANRLQNCVRPGDTTARLGGDEWLVLLEDIHDATEAEAVAERIRAALAAPLPLQGHDVVTEASMGIATGSGEESPHDLLRDADTAMYEAKRNRRGRHMVFDQQMHDQAVQRLARENALKGAAARGEIEVFYQPIVSLRQGHVVGFEALARWRHPTLGWIAPPEFIPLAEETGEIAQLGQTILLDACQQVQIWSQKFGRPMRISVNLSVRQLQDEDLAQHVREALARSQLPAQQLALEITESMLLRDVDVGGRALEDLRAERIKLYMDDFGTGYSSLAYLQRFRVDALKIDGSFVRNMDGGSHGIVRSIVTLGRSLGLTVVAEGVETQAQLERLREIGCDEGQGYLFCRPQPPGEVETLLESDPSW